MDSMQTCGLWIDGKISQIADRCCILLPEISNPTDDQVLAAGWYPVQYGTFDMSTLVATGTYTDALVSGIIVRTPVTTAKPIPSYSVKQQQTWLSSACDAYMASVIPIRNQFMLAAGMFKNLPKSMAMHTWANSVESAHDTMFAAITAPVSTHPLYDFSSCGLPQYNSAPITMDDVIAEVQASYGQ